MKTGTRKHHKVSGIISATMLGLAMIACNFLTQTNSEGQGNPNNGTGQSNPNSTLPGSSAQAACLAGIYPGSTTRDEAVALLGEPLGVIPEGDFETLLYASSLPRQFNSVVVQNQLVVLVNIVLGEDNPQAWSTIIAQYGEPAHTTYNNYMEGSMTYIYPEKGQTFVASAEADSVFIRECYVPISLKKYMNTWGRSLPKKDPFIR